jgi:hypothetical protein
MSNQIVTMNYFATIQSETEYYFKVCPNADSPKTHIDVVYCEDGRGMLDKEIRLTFTSEEARALMRAMENVINNNEMI